VLPEEINLTDFGPVAAGASSTIPVEIKNQGTAPLTLFSNWTTESQFSVSPSQLRLEPGETRAIDLTYSASSGEPEKAVLNIWSDDPLQPVRTGFLVGNQEGLGIGKQLPETKVALLDGSEWTSSQVQGRPLLLAYFATF
jgi:hypothetical protein